MGMPALAIISKAATPAYLENFEGIFGKKKESWEKTLEEHPASKKDPGNIQQVRPTDFGSAWVEV